MHADLWRKLTIRTKVFSLMFIFLIVSSTLLFQVATWMTQQTIRGFMDQYLRLNQEKAQSGFEFLLGEINLFSVRILNTPELYNIITDTTLDETDKALQIEHIFDAMDYNRNAVGYISIVTQQGESYGYGSDARFDQLDAELLSRVDTSPTNVWGNLRKDSDGHNYILLGAKYQDFPTGQRIGYLFIYVKERAFHDVYANMVPLNWGRSFLLSSNNYILSSDESSEIGMTVYDATFFEVGRSGYKTTAKNGTRVIVSSYQLDGDVARLGLNWRIISLVLPKQLYEKIDAIKRYSLMLQIALIVVTLLVSWYVSKRVVNPIRRLTRKLHTFGDQTETSVPNAFISSSNELWILENSFNDMVMRIHELIRNMNENKDRQRESELVALQAQINPHFLYNTLDAITWVAKLNKQSQIEKMVVQLARFYRLCLHKGDKFILVKEEIGIVESYIALENMRFPNKITVEYEISKEVLEDRNLKLVLQPLVENAIKHGIGPKEGEGKLTIKAFKTGDDIYFELTDDGVGFRTDSIKQGISSNAYNGGGYGILNVDARIKLEYGPDYGVEIESEPGKGTVARVKVKAHAPLK